MLDLSGLEEKIAELFSADTAMPGGEAELANLQAKANDAEWRRSFPTRTELARETMKLARQYRRVKMGMANA